MINSVYGKTMDSLRKRMNARLVNNEKDFLKNTSRPTYITHKIFGNDYAAIHEIKPVLMLNKPIDVECTVLDNLLNGKSMTFTTTLSKKLLMLNCYLLTQPA